MDMVIQDFVKTKMALVVIAIDDYRNKVITDKEVSMLIDGEKPTLIKEDGYHIFLKLPTGLHNLSVGGWMFQQQDINIDSEEEKEIGKGVMRVRLQPNYHYLSGKNVTILQGQADPLGELHFVFINEKEPYRLYQDYEAGSKEIAVYHQSETFLDGTLFCLQKADGQVEEFWIEEDSGAETRYELRYPLNDTYERNKCILRRVYVVTADKEGRFYFPVPAEEECCTEYRYYKPLNKREIQTGTFIKGRINDLREEAKDGIWEEEAEPGQWECVPEAVS